MKYIRTKDGIYSYEPTHNIDVDGFAIQHINGWEKPLMREDIVKVVDTIEELCDRYIVVYGKFYTIYKKKAFNRTNHRLLCLDIRDGKKECYGAIWTDKGLIFIARMNNEGVLELL